jgi:elongation factor P
MISVNDLRAGIVFEDDKQYFLVLSYEHIKMGRGSGTIRVKVKNLASGSTTEKTFNTGGRVQDADLVRRKLQYLYMDNQVHVMDMQTYEQEAIDRKMVEDVAKFLKEGMEITVAAIDDKPLFVEVPKIVDYKVVQTGGSARGNTVGASYKDAVLENGLVAKVPLFIKPGEIIKVSTQTGEYAGRGK